MVDVDGSSQFSVDLQPKSIGLVSWSGGGLLTQPQKPYQLATVAVGCHYFPPGLQLPPPNRKKAATNFAAW